MIASNANGSDTAIDTVELAALPQDFFTMPMLASSGDKVQICYGVPIGTRVEIRLYDVNGQLVRRLLEEEVPAGEYSVSWDMRDDNGLRVTPGVYFLDLRADEGRAAAKVVIAR